MNHALTIARSAVILAFALIAYLVPAIGEGRFLLATILVFLTLPLSILVQIRYPVEETGWSQPLFDLVSIVVLVHVVPDAWYLALLVGALLLGAMGIAASRIGYRFYACLMAILIVGMSFAAIVHEVDGWIPVMLALLILLPTNLLYFHQEQHRVDQLHQQGQALENLSLLAGGVSHDFNNMLTTITGNTELALLDLSPDHPSRKPLATAIDGANRASLLSGQLLAFSGRKISDKSIVDLRSEIATIANLMERAIPKGITLALTSTHDPCLVECDQGQIQQVVMNLIVNAGEAVRTVPSTIYLSLTREREQSGIAQWVVLEVRDEGVGIPADMIDSIFDPFVTSKKTGHGLGLASAKRVLEEHHGDIVVESREGVGTNVRLRLPATQAPSEPAISEQANESQHTGLVLVIDDEEQVRVVAGGFLERLGYRTIDAQDGYEGIALFKKRSGEFTAVLLDLKMPGKDGWECLRELREIRSDLPVIISSGYNPGNVQTDAHNLAFLMKPYGLGDMDRAFRAASSTSF